ncbi:MAG: GNAT family N-acetyltransferase [Firmicutes bacterium]|nr:GNAT family N-acetyltransferase [Bacillota bacterium]
MYIVKAEENQVKTIVDISVRAFETDVNVGGAKGDCPPEYDSVEWHKQMAREGHLYQAMIGNDIVGAAIIFPDETKNSVYIGRIFIDSVYHRKGYGIRLMECIEKNYPFDTEFNLDTPSWNVRTNAFYEKLGYQIVKEEDGFVFYRKTKTCVEERES